MAKVGEPAIPALLSGLQSDSKLIRLAATRAVGELPLLTDELRQVLVSRVGDEDASIRRVALNALVDRTADNEELRKLVLQSAADAEAVVRSTAVSAFSKLEFSREQLQGAISAGLEDGDPSVISQALLALSNLPAQLPGQRVRVVALVQHEGADVRQAAIQTLGRLGKDQVDDDVVQAIAKGLEDGDRSVRLTATATVRELGLQHEPLVQRVANNLTDDVDLLRESLETIASFGPQSEALVQNVSHILQHERSEIRSLAIKAMAAIDQQVPRKVEVLRSMLDDGDWEVRRQAGTELGKLGPEAKAAVPRLFELLSSDQDSEYSNQSLEEINAAPVEAVPMLISKLESSERRARFHAMTLLGKIGPAAAEAIPKLEEMLEKLADSKDDRDEFRRNRLRETIRAIRPESVEVK